MGTFDRRSEIVRYLQKNRRASTRALSDRFDVSEVTIRNDLNRLEESGWLTRIHGGAEIAPHIQREQPFDVRRYLHPLEKESIARAAAATIQSGETIVLDGSTTAYRLAMHLNDVRELRIVTNNLYVVNTLMGNKNIEVVLLGGVVRGETATVVGPLAEEMVARLHANKGFFGAAGLIRQRGLTDADIREAQIKRAMIRIVDSVNVLLDSSKFGVQAFQPYAALHEIQRLFTDEKIPSEYVDLCNEMGIELTVVP